MSLNAKTVRIAGSRPKKKAVSRQNKDNLYARIDESKFNRYVVHDLPRYRKYLSEGGAAIYSSDELDALEEAGVSDRLPPRATGYYLDLAKRSDAVKNLIKARPADDLSAVKALSPGTDRKRSFRSKAMRGYHRQSREGRSCGLFHVLWWNHTI